ncbi:MAG: 30S ribosomal protein S9 [Candidatus Diapherotrites archaeon]|uniref:30S ribosomal protein S9 n=1 Tax=Candidatus Iainarchaeum sp. TaxID=3101447 RepID=A0A8T3YK70_9ARCH|nr:30S ribosomal protein S9 [Candidatus Diapherotrites archaeon]
MVDKKKKRKGITSKAKKKEAKARAVVRKGRGIVRINHRNMLTIQPEYMLEYVREPLEIAGPLAGEVNIEVKVHGGGFMGQMVAARSAIAKSLVEFRGDEKLKKRMLAYDRMMLVDDPRRVEPKKPLGRKARKKRQLSRR